MGKVAIFSHAIFSNFYTQSIVLYPEHGKGDYVLFEAANLLRIGVRGRWMEMSEADKTEMVEYVLRYLTEHLALPSAVRGVLAQVRVNCYETCTHAHSLTAVN